MTKWLRLASLLALLVMGFAPLYAAPTDQAAPTTAKATTIRWYTNYQEAAAAAKKDSKPMLLFFTGSDWCGWCKKMEKEIFESPDFIKDSGNAFIFVDLDYPMNKKLSPELTQQNTALKKQYGVTGYPTIVILDSKGNFMSESGYRPGGGKAYSAYLKQLMS